MKKDCAILIPIYNDIPTMLEDLNIRNNILKLGNYDIYLVHSELMKPKKYDQYNMKYMPIDKKIWDNTWEGYNNMCKSPDFYSIFKAYEYVLICQTDAFVFKELDPWLKTEYDYIGGPSINYKWSILPVHIDDCMEKIFKYRGYYLHVNGGLSLRRVEKFIKASKFIQEIRLNNEMSEDIVFSTINERSGKELLKIAPLEVAQYFSTDSQVHEEALHNLFGCHAYDRITNDIENDIWFNISLMNTRDVISKLQTTKI